MAHEIQVAYSGERENGDKLCRVCLAEGAPRGRWLHETRSGGTLASMVMALARVEICRQDGLPDVICGDCLGELEAAHGFRLKCERSDSALRKIRSVPEPVKEEGLELFKMECEMDDLNSNDNNDSVADDSFVKGLNSDTSDTCTSAKTEVVTDKDSNCASSKEKVKSETIGQFICDQCGRPMRSKASLQNHKHRMHGRDKQLALAHSSGYGPNKRYSCSECPFVTPHRQTMRYHSRTHTGERPYQCASCPARFTQAGRLKSHAASHSDDAPFSCSACGKPFKLKEKLERHKLVHSNARPHVCAVCHKGLKTKTSLKNHMNRHLNIRDFRCEQCGAAFVSNECLINHSKRHLTTKNFQCHVCGYKSKTKAALVMHIRTHTAERAFKCPLCEYAATLRSVLRTHMRVHGRKQYFSCSLCQRKMSHSSSLYAHMFRVHGVRFKLTNENDNRTVKPVCL